MSSRYQRISTVDDPLEAHSIESGPTRATNSARPQAASPSPSYSSSPATLNLSPADVQSRQRSDLEETFNESLDDDDHTESTHLLSANTTQTTRQTTHATPSISPEPSTSVTRGRGRPAILPVTNDGVFANMSAKPESASAKLEETPPAYEEAVADATPPYWQTTIIAPPGMEDMVTVDGMPVGNMFHFAWNLLVSASFQFVGFMLTYLLHTTHAAKQGSLAGLGISLVQYGFYIRSRGTLTDNFEEQPSKGDGEMDDATANIIAYVLMLMGWFIIIRSIADYIRARKMERIIVAEPSPETIV